MENKTLLFYGAGEYAELIFKRSKEIVSPFVPVAFIDSDPNKNGKTLCGLSIFSYSDTVSKYGDNFDVYITANELHTPDIIGFLLENDVAKERILNYEPVEKRSGCEYIETWSVLQFNGKEISVTTCNCISESGQKRYRPKIDIKPADFNQETFSHATNAITEIANCISKGDVPECCRNCQIIREKYYFKNKKTRNLLLGGNVACNYKCHHCTNAELFSPYESSVYEDMYNAIDIVERSGVLDKNAVIGFGVGEFTINNRHSDFIKRISNYSLMLYSNGYQWSDAVANALSTGNAELVVSLDAGTAESYQKIKGVDGYLKVCENLQRYAKHGIVILKYIMFDGINVTKQNFDGFYELADVIAHKVVISRDFYGEKPFSNETLKKVAEFIVHFRKKGCLSHIVGYNRENENERLQTLLKEID